MEEETKMQPPVGLVLGTMSMGIAKKGAGTDKDTAGNDSRVPRVVTHRSYC